MSVKDLPERMRIIKPPRGLSAAAAVGVRVLIAIGAATATVLAVLAPRMQAGDLRAMVIFGGVMTILFVAILTPSITYDARSWYAITADSRAISLIWNNLFRVRVREWTLNETSAISTRATFPDNPKTSVAVSVVDRTGGHSTIARGQPNAMRHLATLLRRRTGLPARAGPNSQQPDAAASPAPTSPPPL